MDRKIPGLGRQKMEKNLQKLETIPGLSEDNLSLYAWFKSNPVKNERLLYPMWQAGVPTVLLKYAAEWHDLFVKDYRKHPGDGLLYFYDFLLGNKKILNRYDNHDIKIKKINVYAMLFNYFYSFSNEKGGPLTIDSEHILSLVLYRNPRLAVPLYEFRRKIDLKEFALFTSKVIEKQRLLDIDYILTKGSYEAVEHWLWEAILGFSFPRLLGKWQNRLLNLWAGYTSEAIKRFITLHLPAGKSIISPRDMRDYLTVAETLYLDTKYLVRCYSIALVDECRVPKMSSIGMMQRFHDAENMEHMRIQISQDKAVYEWPLALTNILIDYPEWYIPTMVAEVRLRGAQHNNCVGGYVDYHFKAPKEEYKVLLLFSDLYTSEIILNFKDDKVSKVKVQQVRGCYNKEAPPDVLKCVQEIAQSMEKLTVDAFKADRIDLKDEELLAEARRLAGKAV